MKKVKLFKIYISREVEHEDYDSYNELMKYIPVKVSDMEELTDEKYAELKRYIYHFNEKQTCNGTCDRYMLLEEPEPGLECTAIDEIIAAGKQREVDAANAEIKRLAELAKKKEAAKKLKEEKLLQRKLKQLEKLKKELE